VQTETDLRRGVIIDKDSVTNTKQAGYLYTQTNNHNVTVDVFSVSS